MMTRVDELISRAKKNNIYQEAKWLSAETDLYQLSIIIGATLQLIEDAFNNKEIPRLIIMTPESETLANFIAYLKTASDIVNKRLGTKYDVSRFKKGEKYKYKNCIVEFDKVQKFSSGKRQLRLKLKDGYYSAPIDSAPKLQFVDDTKKGLTTLKRFSSIFNVKDNEKNQGISDTLSQLRTHNTFSNFYVPSLLNHFDQVKDLVIGDKKIREILYWAKLNSKGELESLVSGQLGGTPSLILGKDLFDLNEALLNGVNVNSVIISLNSEKIIDDQLSIIDDLIKIGIPVALITNHEFASSLDNLKKRGFLVWRWGKKEIRRALSNQSTSSPIDIKANIYTKTRVKALYCGPKILKRIMDLLNKYMNRHTHFSQPLEEIYSNLLNLSFKRLRQFLPITSAEKLQMRKLLREYRGILESISKHESHEIIQDFKEILTKLYYLNENEIKSSKSNKIIETMNHLKDNDRFVLVIDNKQNIENTHRYIEKAAAPHIHSKVQILYPNQFLNSELSDVDIILSCWFNEATMKRFVYGNQARNIYIVLNFKEKEWAERAFDRWKKLSKSMNDNDEILHKLYQLPLPVKEESEERKINLKAVDEVEELESTVLRSHVRHYISSDGSKSDNEVNAKLVSFKGNYFAFFTENHHLLRINSILNELSGSAEPITVNDANPGDFILIRESERSLIREIADKILENSGLKGERNIASLWREPLLNLVRRHGIKETYRRLERAGCRRTEMAIYQWINDENRIAPKDKDDIIKIFKVTGRKDLVDEIDRIEKAKHIVERAHISAGRHLSRLLRKEIGEYVRLKGVERIRRANNAVELSVEEIGTVMIYEISAIDNTNYKVNSSHANTVLKE